MTNFRGTWTVRAYRPGDEDGIRALFELVFRKPLSRAWWRWKLHTLPTPTENEWVADAGDGGIVGHYAASPIRFLVDGRRVIVPHGCDAMTHPAFQRQGIMTAIGTRANEAWRAAGSPFQIGFHYGGWGSVREGLGWRPAVRMVWLRLRVRPLARVARLVGWRAPKSAERLYERWLDARTPGDEDDCEITRVRAASDVFDRLWLTLAPCYRVAAVRDRAWVQWRYLDAPDCDQRVWMAQRGEEPLGYLAYRVHRDTEKAWAVILDCFTAPTDRVTTGALLRHARRELLAQGVESIAALVVLDSPLYEALRAAGYSPRRQGYDFSVVPYADVDAGYDPRDWFLTGAEGDCV